MLGEWAGWRRWSAIFAGFIGVLVITRPGVGVFGIGHVFALCSMLSNCFYVIMTRRLSATETPESLVLFAPLAPAALLFPPLQPACSRWLACRFAPWSCCTRLSPPRWRCRLATSLTSAHPSRQEAGGCWGIGCSAQSCWAAARCLSLMPVVAHMLRAGGSALHPSHLVFGFRRVH